MKKSEGITLIALVITIIILLILAGVTLKLVTGNDGIFILAENSTEKYKEAEEKEKNEIAKLEDYIENSRDTVTISKEEYEQLKNDTVSSKIKMGQVTMKGSNNNGVAVVFDEPFKDDNYVVFLQIQYKAYFNVIQYSYSNKTEQGFNIYIATSNAGSNSYDMIFDWVAIHK